MSAPGWYPDPSGQPGMFRWWDGTAWTPSVTPNRFDPPPLPPGGQLPIHAAGQPVVTDYAQIGRQAPSRRPLALLAGVGVLVVALVIGGAWLLLRALGNPLAGGEPASNPTSEICPTSTAQIVSPTPHVHPAGRVRGGDLSYPLLGSPWGSVDEEHRLAFGRDVYGQMVLVHRSYQPGRNWVASLVVGELVAGDGFFSPQQGSEIVTKCIIGAFYGDAEIGREDRVNQATTVDGRDAWLVEMHLTFDIPGLAETGETAIVLIVATSEASSSIYYASIPDSTPALLVTARQVQEQLRVES